MRPYFRLIIGIIIIWFGVKAIRQVYSGYELGLFQEFQYIPFALLIIFTISAFLLDITYYKLYSRIFQYGVSFIGFVFCVIVILKMFQLNSIDKSKTVLQISNLPGATNVLTFEFKTNNKFRLTEYNRLGQTVYHGKYDKRNDTLYILESNYNSLVKKLPITGVIKLDTVFWVKLDTMIVDKK